jgi:hypothetical protein
MKPQSRPRIFLIVVLAALLVTGSAVAAKRTLQPNPADDPALVGKRLDPNRYDGAGGCVRRDPKGMKQLIRWMKRTTKRNTIYGTIRCDGGVHGTGRALDWMLDARDKRQKRKATRVINTWLAKDRRGRPNALARRMGIQLIIYNCRWWQAGDRGWQRYSACGGDKRNADPTQGHIDHIHVELTKPASKLRTSFWETDLIKGGGAGDGGGGGVSPRRAAQEHPPLHPPEPELEALTASG